ncbi:5'-nucleotidase C-terminal domain-containing protein [Agrococcus sp. ARC_14]|uniref:bifunctional metallophosphatase/5'-nucleotidase n=1 Tax=Agrococcus sp. ARC_14 TaxID=2919927 RepID=UPI001F050989|nr:5'-nucleotidase C-terminal domain-containing protein [Agrococcus sp. ARC_14]MCH1882172.1 5'-nucleotidase C-terminal domain-containing protein [Agrococcus sp. ARC_14]
MPNRTRLAITAAAAAAALAIAPATAAVAAPGDPIDLTLLSTTDNHGHAVNWDYFTNAPYPAGEELGLARAGTLIEQVRAERGDESVLLFDNGDAIQGTPLTYLTGMLEPVTETGDTHPMAAAFNELDYDAQVVGNHEYNYGLDLLDTYDAQLDAPLLGANAVDASTGEPTLPPTTMVERTIDGQTVQVGVIGVVTPGVRVWDRAIVEGVVEFEDQVETVERYVPELEAAGADLVVVLAHTGFDPESQTYDPAALQENLATTVAGVQGVDVVVAGHSHQDNPQTIVEQADGGQALVTQPVYWGGSVSRVDLQLVPAGDGFEVNWADAAPTGEQLYTSGDVAEHAGVVAAVQAQHDATVEYVNTEIATLTETMSGATSRYEDTALIDFVNEVQTETVRDALVGTDYEGSTVISQASPFNRDVVVEAGSMTVRDMAALYIYENTLMAVELSGAELRDYLEWSARYFVEQEVGAEITADVAGAYDEADGRPFPDYSYDVVDGIDYTFDISQPVGERLVQFEHQDGTVIADDDVFVMGINNYRQSGGSGYPHVVDAPVVYNGLLELRQLLIDYATDRGTIDPAEFADVNWALTTTPLVDETPAPTDPVETEPAPTDPAETEPAATEPAETAAPGDDQSGGELPRTAVEPSMLVLLFGGLLVAAGALLALRSRKG